MIFRIYPSKDTFIANARVRSVPQTGSNYGFAESLHVYKVAGVSGATGPTSGSELARSLLYFSTASLDAFIAAGYSPSDRPKFYHLRLKHETTRETLPSSYDIEILAVSGAWDEGRGMDYSNHYDKGFANWWKRTSTEYWSSRGGDFWASPRDIYHIDTGFEDVDRDVTAFFNSWSSGTIPNHGLGLRITSSLESDTIYDSYYLKSFYSRHSRWPDRRPYVEVRWDDFLADDRGRMRWGQTGSLLLHNIVDGQYSDLSIGQNALIVRVADASGTLLSVTASHSGMTGIYSATFALPSSSYSGSVFYDLWGSGSFSFMTGTFTYSYAGPSTSNQSREYVAKIVNLRDFYDPEEVVRFDVFFKRRGYRQSVVSTASAGSPPEIIEKAYYAFENDSTRERIVPFGTGSLQYTRLSYDVNGNYFLFPMSSLHSGEVYRVLFLVDRDGRNQVLDSGIKFRVR